MKNYNSYMERQSISPETHEALLNLEPGKRRSGRPWARYGALAACAALIVGVGVWKLVPASGPAPNASSAGQFAADYTPLPGQKDTVDPPFMEDGSQAQTGAADFHGFVVDSPMDEEQYMSFFAMPAIAFPDMTGAPQAAACRAYYAPGSFLVDLEKEDIQKLFWGPEGKPENTSHDLPWTLFWDGYTVHGSVWYDGQGQLMELTVYGEKGRASFDLELRLGALPFTCCVDLNRGDEISEFNGVEIAGWSQVYDRDGDGLDDYICGSEFMTKNDIGVRFTSRNNGKTEDGVDGESWFNTLFVREALTGGLHLDHLMTAESVPAWREEEFVTLAQAREETDFAPYLPKAEPEGYNSYSGNKEFHSYLSYQEGTRNTLFVRWSRGYDNVEVDVYRDGYHTYYLAEPDNPETYDLRLYPIPWCDSVPRKYWNTVNDPAFRAEDMSLAIVEARGQAHDTGAMTYSFNVLHPDGTLVSYRCDGMTARQVWEMVAETL